MPYVPVPKDLSKVKTKIVLNLTKRQLVCFSAAAAVGIPLYLSVKPVLGTQIAVFIMMGLTLPFFFAAIYEKDGQPAERIAINILRSRFLWPAERPFKTENLYKSLEDKKIDARKEKTGGISPKKKNRSKKKPSGIKSDFKQKSQHPKK